MLNIRLGDPIKFLQLLNCFGKKKSFKRKKQNQILRLQDNQNPALEKWLLEKLMDMMQS